jgi:Protein of unknown function (DUF3455)
MKDCNTPHQPTRRILPIACATAVAVACTVSVPRLAQAHEDEITPPSVPAGLEAPAGQEAFLVGHAVGTQNYICLPTATGGFAFTLFTPQATLFTGRARQVITHFFSPNPFEKNRPVRATWEHSRDSSTVWGAVMNQSQDVNFVKAGAIPWLLVRETGVQDGPTGGDTLSGTCYIQRVNTSGGSAPSSGCAGLADVGTKAFMAYTADYFFYTDHRDGDCADRNNR